MQRITKKQCLCGELLMKHLHGGRRRYQRNSQGTSISASHESEQLSELIRDYEGHACNSAANLKISTQCRPNNNNMRRAAQLRLKADPGEAADRRAAPKKL